MSALGRKRTQITRLLTLDSQRSVPTHARRLLACIAEKTGPFARRCVIQIEKRSALSHPLNP